MFDALYFEYPKVFTFLVIFIACDAYCKLRSRAIYFPHAAQLTQEGASMAKLLLFLKWLGVVMLILALMSPVKDKAFVLAPSNPRAIVYVIDSTLKDLGDLKSQLAVFIDEYKDFEQGMVAFDKSAYVVSPLSRDALALTLLLPQISTTEAAIAQEDAFYQMRKVFKARELEEKVALIFTDDINSSRTLKKQFASERIRFYLFDDEAGLRSFLADVRKKEKIEKISYTFKNYYYIYPLFFSFVLFLLYVYLRNRRSV